ncbi:MAG: beta-lactamase family protein [Gammaproteobacteria bacterium]|nr:beta-lactamase family protein [Gammaproteobacteria bacterium]
MSFSSSLNLARLFLSLTNANEATKPILDNIAPQKPNINTNDTSTKLERAKPSDVGVCEKYIESFFNEVEKDFSIFMNRCLVLKDNKVIYEYIRKPYKFDSWNCSFSLTKTTVGLAIGFLYDEGLINLDEKAYKILKVKGNINPQSKNITIRDLLTNTTGNRFNESFTAVSTSWVKEYFSNSCKFKPGTKFEYNSLNSYILSAIVKERSGMSLTEYLKKKLYDPLGIYDFYYSKSPEDIEEGGWGLYITPEDMAKLGLIILNKGSYNGAQIISEEWISEMVKSQVKANIPLSNYDYGYQVWTKEDSKSIVFNGMFDQDIVVFKENNMVLIWCSSNNDAFHSNKVFKIAEKYFKEPIKEKFRFSPKVDRFIDTFNPELKYYYTRFLDNHSFSSDDKTSNSLFILPVLMQITLNIYGKGIKTITFDKDENGSYINLDEGESSYKIYFDFKDGIYQILDVNSNIFEINASARIYLDESNRPYVLFRIYFLEFSSQRFIKVYLTRNKNEVEIEFSENPSKEFLLYVIKAQDEKTKKLFKSATSLLNKDILEARLNDVLCPRIMFNKIKSEQ